MAASMIAWVFEASARGEDSRRMTLEDCIHAALEKNLDIKIGRYTVTFARLDLDAAYQGWDPVFDIGGDHSFSRRGGGLDADQRAIPASEIDRESFSGGLNGLTPWGMNYVFFGDFSDTYGTVERFNTNTLAFEPDPSQSSQGSVGVRLSQPLLKNFWIDSTRLNIAVAKNQIEWESEGFSLRVMDIVTLVENAYFDLVAARENVKVQELALQLARQLLADNRKRVEVGALAPLDEKQSEAEVAGREADLLAARRTYDLQMNTLKSLLTDDFSGWHQAIIEPVEALSGEPVPLDIQDSWGRGLTQRPDLVQRRLDLERQGYQLKYLKNQLFPQLDAFGSYGFYGSDQTSAGYSETFNQIGEGNQPFWSAGMRLTIPLMNTGARANYRRGRALEEQTLLATKKLEQDIMVEIDDAVKFARASLERVTATRAARGYAEAALEAEQQKLENGKSTSFVVLQLQRDLTTARSAEISALSEYNKALSALARREGSTLRRRGINLDPE
jgi:outer membrane protein TolC